jgi:hypothetical protein
VAASDVLREELSRSYGASVVATNSNLLSLAGDDTATSYSNTQIAAKLVQEKTELMRVNVTLESLVRVERQKIVNMEKKMQVAGENHLSITGRLQDQLQELGSQLDCQRAETTEALRVLRVAEHREKRHLQMVAQCMAKISTTCDGSTLLSATCSGSEQLVSYNIALLAHLPLEKTIFEIFLGEFIEGFDFGGGQK